MSAASRRYRISLLTTGLAHGGAETQVVFLAKGLKDRGWEVAVESMLPPQAFEETLEISAIPLIPLCMRRGVPDPRAIARLARHWRSFRPHIVHSHMIHANILARVTRMIAPVPVLISTAHSVQEGAGWRDSAYQLTDSLADLTTNVSKAGADRYTRLGLSSVSKTVFVPNGLDVEAFAPDSELRMRTRSAMGWGEELVWLAVGNLRTPKDYPNLLKAFAKVHTQHRCRLAIAGSGELLHPLQLLSSDLGLSDAVSFLGARSDIRELLQAADCFVMSSEWEGTPIALLEACASSLCAVATAVGGNPEVIDPERTGFLVPPQNPEALASAMARVMKLSQADRLRIGATARARVESYYGGPRILDLWENIYSELLLAANNRRFRWSHPGLLTKGGRLWLN